MALAPKSGRILNIGCNNDFYGTDRIDIVKTAATTKVWDVNNGLPYPDNTFSEIKARFVLEHIKNLGVFVDECYRVLKKGGRIYIRTDHAGYLPMYVMKSKEHNKMLKWHYDNGDEDHHYHLFVISHLDLLFRRFKNRRFRYHYSGRNMLAHVILKIIPFHMGAMQIDMWAEK